MVDPGAFFRPNPEKSLVMSTAQEPSASAPAADPNRVRIFDTTLRDGEQSPGASMNLGEKLEVARVLSGLGVDVIEAGFPIASQGDFEAVRAIAGEITGSTVCGLRAATRRTSTVPGTPSGTRRPRASTSSWQPRPSTASTSCA